jgi:hypothetical protein
MEVTVTSELELIPSEHTTIDYLVTADYAEVVNGKLYLMGGGWDKFRPPSYPSTMRMGIAVGIRVPYLDANVPHHLTVVLRSADGEVAFKLEGQIETGRPPGSRGEPSLVPVAVNALIELAKPTSLELIADVDGQSVRRIPIHAIP